MTFRRFVLVTHRWLGLFSSVVLVILGATGAVLLFPVGRLVHRLAQHTHEQLYLGRPGWWIVVLATIAAVVLKLGGLVLWWRRKVLTVRTDAGTGVTIADLHHASGAIAFLLMAALAVTGIGMAFIGPDDFPDARRVIFDLHTTRNLPIPVRVFSLVGTVGFVVQGVTGVLMWWRRPSRDA